VKQVRPAGGVVPPSSTTLLEGGQPTVEVSPTAEVAPNALSSILAKRKRDDCARALGLKKLRGPMSLCALRQATGLTLGVGCPLSLQDLPPASLAVKASIAIVATSVTPASSPPLAMPVQEAAPDVVEVSVPTALPGFVMASLSTIVAPLLSVGVVTTSAFVVPPHPSSSDPLVLPFVVLAVVSPSSSSYPSECLCVKLILCF